MNLPSFQHFGAQQTISVSTSQGLKTFQIINGICLLKVRISEVIPTKYFLKGDLNVNIPTETVEKFRAIWKDYL